MTTPMILDTLSSVIFLIAHVTISLMYNELSMRNSNDFEIIQ